MAQLTVNLQIQRFGRLTHALAGKSNRGILAENCFKLFVLRRLPPAQSHPVAVLKHGFLNKFVCKVFPPTSQQWLAEQNAAVLCS